MELNESFQNLEKLISEQKINKNEFRQFLEQQVSLPKDQWSDEFRKYVREKIEEKKKEGVDKYPEGKNSQEKTFLRYLNLLDLGSEDLLNKKIADLGCGEEFEFVRECSDKNITQEIYGLDLVVDLDNIDNRYEGHIWKGDFIDKLPKNDFDYLLSVGTTHILESIEDDKLFDLLAKKMVNNALTSLNKSGELRIFPVDKTHPGSNLIGAEVNDRRWNKIIQDLEKDIEYEFKPKDIIVGANEDTDVALQRTLIIRRKNLKVIQSG